MDILSEETLDIQTLLERQKELEKQWKEILGKKRDVEAREKALAQREMQFELKWNLLLEETQRLADDKENFDRKQKFYERVSAHEKQSSVVYEDNIVHGEMFFSGVSTKSALKKRYKDLIKIYHPDSEGGDNETVAEINREYDNLKEMMM